MTVRASPTWGNFGLQRTLTEHAARSAQLCWLGLVLAALSLAGGCGPASSPPDTGSTDTTPPSSTTDTDSPPTSPNDDQNNPPTNPQNANNSIAGQLTVQWDEPAPATLKDFRPLALSAAPTGQSDTPGASESVVADSMVPGEVLVTFDQDLPLDQRGAILADSGLRLVECSPSGVCRATVAVDDTNVPKDSRSPNLAAIDAQDRLRGQGGVCSVEPNHRRHIARTPNDPFFPYQWHWATIHLPEAWDMTTGSDDVIVAVVDTGILSKHPDLQGRLVAGYDFISDPASARDGDGRDSDPEDKGDLFGGPGQSSFHGTHVSGIIAASTNNAVGVAGATWQTKIMPLRALGIDGGTAFDVTEAVRYAAGLPNVSGTLPARRANIINLSLVGAPGENTSSAEMAAIAQASAAGVIIVGAAGNDGSSLPAYPAAAPEVISVSAVDIQLQRADYSNYGSSIDLAAPGGFLGSDFNGDGFADGILSIGGSDLGGTITYEYLFANGTSMAAPQVAAVAALVLAANPSLSAADVREILESTARDLGPAGQDDDFGHGLVDAAAAVREAYRRAGTTPPAADKLSVSNSTVNFGTDLAEYRVQVVNTGGNPLTINSVTAQPLVGTGWLHAQAAPVAPGASSGDVTITVDRTGLTDGSYDGVVTIQAAGLDPADVDVLMAVGPAAEDHEIIYVLAVDPDTRDTIGDTATNGRRSYVYTIANLPAGAYVIYAGTDRDNNGYICEQGDLCGALPSRLEPQTITLGENEHRTATDFSVARLVLQQMTGGNSTIGPLKRIQR